MKVGQAGNVGETRTHIQMQIFTMTTKMISNHEPILPF